LPDGHCACNPDSCSKNQVYRYMPHLSEEEIRSLLVMPLLSSIGVEPHAIRLEQSFSIRLGRGVYDVKGTERDLIGGRLDVLCLLHDRHMIGHS
jgi:hypothetical protein